MKPRVVSLHITTTNDIPTSQLRKVKQLGLVGPDWSTMVTVDQITVDVPQADAREHMPRKRPARRRK